MEKFISIIISFHLFFTPAFCSGYQPGDWKTDMFLACGKAVGGTVLGKLTWDAMSWISADETQAIEKRRRENMATSGHECVSYSGGIPECYPYRLEIESAVYGVKSSSDSERSTENLKRLCGEGTRPWCHFSVSNDVLAKDLSTGSILDPAKGKDKTLNVVYRCISPLEGRLVGKRPEFYKEGEKATLSCTDHFPTVFRAKGCGDDLKPFLQKRT